MCLGIPGQVVQLRADLAGQVALVNLMGSRREVNVGMLDGASLQPGDWVLVHMGFAIEHIDAATAQDTLAGLEAGGRPPEAAVPQPGPQGS
ncbi:MAG: HypC/HybG/HupF family hydrogenase formation chaperone [Actinomycetota bacterium]|nr:HypC/HybG/HupF family hydrogenase formation chaperone [Actinomycetota bacterium]